MDNSWRKTALRDALITCVITIIVCLVINFFLSAPKTGLELGESFLVPAFATGIIIGIIQIIVKKTSAKKGKGPELPSNKLQASYLFVPEHPLAFLIFFSIAVTIFVGLTFGGFFALFFTSVELPTIAVMIISSCVTGMAAAYVTYHCSVFLVSYYQHKHPST